MQATHCARHRQKGFTLIEAAVATMVVGVGIVALVHSLSAGTKVNQQGRNITQGVFLAQEIREWTIKLPFSDPDPADAVNPPGADGTNPQTFVDDLDDLMGVTFSPPRDGTGKAITDAAGWSQQILMEWKDPNSLTTTVPAGSSDVVCVTVAVSRNNAEITRASWLVTRRPEP